MLKILFKFLFFALRAGILKAPGIKFKIKGYTIQNPKVIQLSIIKLTWLLVNIPQKQIIK